MRKPDGSAPFYVVIEKILAPGEVMPRFAGVAGTTGYDALNCISRVLLDADGLPTLEQTWQIQAAPGRNFDEMVADAKARIINSTLSSEFTVLTRLLARIAAGHWPSRDYTEDRLRAALQAFITHFPVYRTVHREAMRSVRSTARQLPARSTRRGRIGTALTLRSSIFLKMH